MFAVIEDHKLVYLTDSDDAAWDISQEDISEGKCEEAYVEEIYEHDFGADGTYATAEGDVITLKAWKKAERF